MVASELHLIVAACGAASRGAICGLDPVLRAVLAGQQAGLGGVVVIAEAGEHGLWQRRLAAHPRLRIPSRLVDPAAALAAQDALLPPGAAEVVLAAADTVGPPGPFKALLAPLEQGRRAALATQAGEGVGRAEDFAGVARTTREALPALLPALLEGSDALFGALEGLDGEALEPRPAGPFQRLRTPGDAVAAEQLLLRSLVKPTDGVVSRHINRKVSLAITRVLCRTSVVPNMVTGVVLLLGLLSGVLAARGDYWGFALGALLYYLGAILDGCDGELSRLKFLGSPLGVWLDTITDDLSALSYICGLYWGLHRTGGQLWLVLGAVAVASNLLTVLLLYRILLRLGTGDHQRLTKAPDRPPASGLGRAVQWVKHTIARTDFVPCAAFVTAAAGVPWLFAYPYPAGALAALVDTLLLTVSFGKPPAGPAEPVQQ